MEQKIYDIIIIGSGPAGLCAAIYAKRAQLDMLVIEKDFSSGGQMVKTYEVDNYPGLPGMSGYDMAEAFRGHADKLGAVFVRENVKEVQTAGELKKIITNKNQYLTRTLVIAAGARHRTLGIPGEEEFSGMGVSYCATCDAPLYKGRSVVVVGYSEESIHEANYIAEIAEHVDFVPVNVKTDDLKSSINVVKDVPLRIEGEQSATRLVLKNQTLNTDGIFVLRDSVEPSQLVNGLEIEDGHIKVNRQMETNFHGLFAAGDCTGKPYQYMKAAGEGHVAGLSAVDQIDKENAGIQ